MNLNNNFKKTKKLPYIFFLTICNILTVFSYAQSWEDIPVYTNINDALKSPNSVKRIDLSKQKLTKIPAEVFTTFPNLFELVLSKNKLTKIPAEIGLLKNLRILKIDRNKFDELPNTLGNLNKLELLDVSRSDLYSFPETLGNCSSLEAIIAWDTNISNLPKSLKKCNQLRLVNLRNIEFSDSAQEELKALLPGVDVQFTTSCNCGPNP